MNVTGEWDLIRRCRWGSASAFEPLVRKYEGEALALAEAMLADRDDAADAVQDAFIRAYRGLGRLTEGSSFGPWFRAILRNLCLDRLRAPARRRRVDLADSEGTIELRVEPTGGDVLERAELAAEVQRALRRISDEHRVILVLKEMQGMSYAEIARELSIPPGTVASRLYHARSALKQALLGQGFTPEGPPV